MAAQQRYGLPVVGVSLGQNLIHSWWLIKNGHFWSGLSRKGDVVADHWSVRFAPLWLEPLEAPRRLEAFSWCEYATVLADSSRQSELWLAEERSEETICTRDGYAGVREPIRVVSFTGTQTWQKRAFNWCLVRDHAIAWHYSIASKPLSRHRPDKASGLTTNELCSPARNKVMMRDASRNRWIRGDRGDATIVTWTPVILHIDEREEKRGFAQFGWQLNQTTPTKATAQENVGDGKGRLQVVVQRRTFSKLHCLFPVAPLYTTFSVPKRELSSFLTLALNCADWPMWHFGITIPIHCQLSCC